MLYFLRNQIRNVYSSACVEDIDPLAKLANISKLQRSMINVNLSTVNIFTLHTCSFPTRGSSRRPDERLAERQSLVHSFTSGLRAVVRSGRVNAPQVSNTSLAELMVTF